MALLYAPALVTGLLSIAIVQSGGMKVSGGTICCLWVVVVAEGSAAGRLSELIIGPSAIGLSVVGAHFEDSLGGVVSIIDIPAVETAGSGFVAFRGPSARYSSGTAVFIEKSEVLSVISHQR